jgi:hypothetical protein
MVEYWSTPNGPNYRNRHARVGDVEFFAFPHQPYLARVGNTQALVSYDGLHATLYHVLPGGHCDPFDQEHFEDKDATFEWAAQKLLEEEAK